MRGRKGSAIQSAQGNHGPFGTNTPSAEQKLRIAPRFDGIVGKSAVMEKVFSLMERALLTDSPVLLLGETGTGKELVARALHFDGPRKGKPFIIQNCGAMTSTLYESELFGHKRGAFTGAIADRRGLFEEADGGTIFLDEIGEAPLDLQIRLLRAIDCGEIRRVGENQSRKVDVRVLAATNQDLSAAVEAGRFRQDLLYRLNAFQICLPPLRDRREDFPLLANHFLQVAAGKIGKRVGGFTEEAIVALRTHYWPGNVRELENKAKWLVTLIQEGEMISQELLAEQVGATSVGCIRCIEEILRTGETLCSAEQHFKRKVIKEALRTCGTITKTAEQLGMCRQSLQQMMRHLGMHQQNHEDV